MSRLERALILHLCLTFAAFASLSGRARIAGAQAAHKLTSGARDYSKYELQVIQRARAAVGGGEVELEPNGKIIEAIDIVRFDVIEDVDPAPKFLNVFHATTRKYVVERELLLSRGQAFDQRLSDETERNLRSLFLFSVVVALPLRGSAPDKIRYLVVTKDIWSLRAGWAGRFANGVVDQLSVRPTETNLLGTSRQLSGLLSLTARTLQIGAGVVEPRLAGSRLRIAVDFSTIVNCRTGGAEGYTGSFQYTRPLYSSRARWAYGTSVSFSQGIARLVGSQGRALCQADNSPEVPLALNQDIDVDDPEQRFAIVPNEYHYDSQSFTQSFTRSFGWIRKFDLSFGLEASRTGRTAASTADVRLRAGSPGSAVLTPEERSIARAWYLRRVAPGFIRINPFFAFSQYFTSFQRDINVDTLGLQEDFRLGPIVQLRFYPVLDELGSSREFLGLNTSASYALSAGTGYLRLEGSHNVEIGASDETHASVSVGARLVSPHLRYGRFVYATTYYNVYHQYYNSTVLLDNTTRLRGYRARIGSNELYGVGYFASNLEFRTIPLQIFSVAFGAIAFYDLGDAFYERSDMNLKHGAGFGIRFLAPQLDRDVFRVDLGFPLDAGDPHGDITVNATFGQAF